MKMPIMRSKRFGRLAYFPLVLLCMLLTGLAHPAMAQGFPEQQLFSTMDSDALVHRLLGRPAPYRYEPPDANGDGRLDVADLVKTILGNPREDARQYLPRIELRLSRPEPQGALVNLSWEVSGVEDPAAYAVFLRAHTPSVVTTGSLAVQPGVAPATGSVYYLQPGTTLGLDHDIYGLTAQPFALDGATSRGQAWALLYADMPGEWAFEAQLIPTTTTLSGSRTYGDVVASSMATLLMAEVPAMRLSVNRSIAGTGDEVIAELRTVAGAGGRRVRLYGWLTRPDGSELTLPSLDSSLEPMLVGNIEHEVHRLMRRSLGEYGTGRFVVHAAMYDEATSRLLSLAQAPVLISDAPSTVTGRVLVLVNDHPTPIDGPTFDRARVRAFDVDDLATAEADVDSSGTYRLILPPGRYRLGAAVRNRWTNHADSLTELQLLHGGAGVDRDFTLDTLTTASGSVMQPTGFQRRTAAAQLAQGAAPVTRPRLFVKIDIVSSSGTDTEARAMAQRHVDNLRRQMPDIEVVTSEDLRDLLRRTAELESTNQANTHLLEAINSAQATYNPMFVTVRDDGTGAAFGRFKFETKLFDSRTQTMVYRPGLLRNDNAADLLDAIDQRDARDLLGVAYEIIRNNPVPARPKVLLALASQEVYGGSSVEARVTLLDEANGQPVNGKTVTVMHRKGPDYRTVLESLTGTTGTSGPGEFTVRLQAPTDADFCEIRAVFERDGQSWHAPSRLYSVLRVNSGTALKIHDAPLSFSRWEPGWLGKVAFRVEDAAGNPISGIRVNASGVNCRVEDDQPVSDLLGITRFDFYAGDQNGHAAVHAACVLPGDPTTIHRAVFKFQVVPDARIAISRTRPQIQSVQASNRIRLFSEPSEEEGLVPLYVTVYKGEDALPAVPVSLTVQGEGSLWGAQSQTDLYGVSHVAYLPPQYRRGTAQITAVAMVGDEITTAALDLDYDPGLVVQAWIPDFLGETGSGRVEVRVGRAQETGDPLWEAGATVTISASDGTVASPVGQTDAWGFYRSNINVNEDVDRMLVSVSALTSDGRTASQQVVAPRRGMTRLYCNYALRTGAYSEIALIEENLRAVNGHLTQYNRYNYSPSGISVHEKSRMRMGRVRAEMGIVADQAYNFNHGLNFGTEDMLLINDPALTGQVGTGFVQIHPKWSHSINVSYFGGEVSYPKACNSRILLSVALESTTWHQSLFHVSGNWTYRARTIYEEGQGIVYEPGMIAIPENVESGQTVFAPFRFVYGEPFMIYVSAFLSQFIYHHADEPQGASTRGEIDCEFSITVDNPHATVVTESGLIY